MGKQEDWILEVPFLVSTFIFTLLGIKVEAQSIQIGTPPMNYVPTSALSFKIVTWEGNSLGHKQGDFRNLLQKAGAVELMRMGRDRFWMERSMLADGLHSTYGIKKKSGLKRLRIFFFHCLGFKPKILSLNFDFWVVFSVSYRDWPWTQSVSQAGFEHVISIPQPLSNHDYKSLYRIFLLVGL